MIDKKLLVICHSYNNFQKDPIEESSKYFRTVDVMVRCNLFTKFCKYIPFVSVGNFDMDYKFDLHNKPSNINVYPTPLIYAPLDFQYKQLGEKHFKFVDRIINKNNLQFDIVHSHFAWSSGYVGAKLKEKYGVPFVVTCHGKDIYDFPFRDEEWSSNIEYVLNSADAIITVSNSNLECINKLNVKTPVTVLPNGYREDIFYPVDLHECRKLLGLPSDKKIILSVGNLEEVKGHKYLIEAMNHIIQKRKDVICFIIGGGNLESKLNKQIQSAGLQSYVKLVGGKLHNEIPLWMNACDVFVLPSLRESFGVVQIESMACGKPVVATCNGGSEGIIVSDDYGLLCDSAKSKELAENVLLALDKNWDSKKIIEYASQFKWSNINKCIVDLYNTLSFRDNIF